MLIIGVDFHPEFQEIASVDTDTGEYQEKRLTHPAGNLHGGVREGGDVVGAMVDLNGHEAGNGGHSQVKPTALRPLLYSERRDVSTVSPEVLLTGSLQPDESLLKPSTSKELNHVTTLEV